MMFTNGLKNTLNSFISTQKYSQNVYENTKQERTMKSILLEILTLDGLGYLKLAAYQTFLVVLWIQEMMLIQYIMGK